MIDCRTREAFNSRTEAWRDLACAIVMQAIDDYSMYLIRSQKEQKSKLWSERLLELDDFFHSDFCSSIIAVDPESMMVAIREKALKKRG